MSDINPIGEEITSILFRAFCARAERISWKCEACEKMHECEAKEGIHGDEPRYCVTLIAAVIRGGTFGILSVPFPRKENEQ